MATTMAKPSQAITFLLRSTRSLSFRPHLVPSRALISIPHLSMPTRRAFHTPRGGGGHRNGIASVGRRLGGVRAAQVNESGSVPSPLIQSMENKIKESLNADMVIVKDESGDGQHVSIYVVSSAFEGQTAVSRQRMVYKAIWEELQNTVHAVDQMVTRTPSEAAK